ncbi:c-type cytochrome biogenesis protein CcmI [Muricoccus radiodurans]|uniref:c-type cytochrome biogenesis protein CcmI n=1 Tax=Muricoccus radiodurans TaxID=2231721 RepID=UPI003CF2A548
MIWLVFGALALLALAPLALSLLRPARWRDRADADRALYRAQVAELDRERAAGRLDEAAHAAALLEVQRRALALPDAAQAGAGGGRGAMAAALFFIPAAALAVYLWNGFPGLPSATFAARQEAGARDEALLAMLRQRLASLPPGSPQFSQGWTLLAEAERNRGRPAAAAEAYAQILSTGFDADVAGQRAQALIEAGQAEAAAAWIAEALPRAPDHVGLRFLAGLAEAEAGRPAGARAAWTALIASAPEGAPWRGMVERRMQALP